MQQSARFGIENYQRLEEQCVKVRLHIFIWIILYDSYNMGHIERRVTAMTSCSLEPKVSKTGEKQLIEHTKELELP